ncbi:MAG: radical SAM protein [Desulfurococcales archaeon]|nr:radical SAM protein [Desulfurococcales archaeon]
MPVRLRVAQLFDPWKSPLCTCPVKYSLNPYTGCSIGCKYCYATAYIGEKDSSPKKMLLERLRRDLEKMDPRLPINIGTSSDPYPPEEESLGLTRSVLELLVSRGRRILITTKGTLYASRDLDLLASGNVAVTPSITMLDELWSRRVEPRAPGPAERIHAVEKATRAGVPVGVRVDPVIPYINDDPSMLRELVARLAEAGAKLVITSTYKARPDNLARMRRLPEVGEKIYRLYRDKGVRAGGYTYLPRSLREELLKPVIEEARRLGLEYATCREGLTGPQWFRAGSCDGVHLIPSRVSPRTLESWS